MFHRLAACALLAPLLAASAAADVIGLDAVRFPGVDSGAELFAGADYQELRQTLVGLGHELRPVTRLDAASLAEFDAVFLRLPWDTDERYTSSEQQALEAFVDAGGGLVVLGTGSSVHVDNMNELMAPYGIEFGPQALALDEWVIREWAPDPLLDQVSVAGFTFVRPTVARAWPASDLSLRSGFSDVVTISRGSPVTGTVVALGDSSFLTDAGAGAAFPLGAFDNAELLIAVTGAALGSDPCAGRTRFFGIATDGQLNAHLPRLTATCPTLGTPLTLAVDRGTPNATGVVLLGLAETLVLWPTPGSGTPAVQQWVAPLTLLPHQLDAAGRFRLELPLPADPALEGLPLFAQVAYGPLDDLISASQPIELRAGF